MQIHLPLVKRTGIDIYVGFCFKVQEPVLSDAVECLAAHFNVYNENGGLILSPEGNVSSDRKFFDDLGIIFAILSPILIIFHLTSVRYT